MGYLVARPCSYALLTDLPRIGRIRNNVYRHSFRRCSHSQPGGPGDPVIQGERTMIAGYRTLWLSHIVCLLSVFFHTKPAQRLTLDHEKRLWD